MNIENPTAAFQVNRLLRCRNTHRYFNGAGWTPDVAQAKSFPSQLDAIRECLQHKLTAVDLVLRSHGGGADLFSTALW